MKKSILVGAAISLTWSTIGWLPVSHAAAPARSGQPYAESVCNTDPNIIFCEDFNYPQNFFCSLPEIQNNHRWINPGWREELTGFVFGCMGRRINPASQYAQKPQGNAPSGTQADYVWAANWDPTQGTQSHGGSPGKLLLDSGGTYANGTPAATELYFRLQIYWTPNYVWPGDPKIDKYNYGGGNTNGCYDNKILYWFPPGGMDNPTSAAFDAGMFTACGMYDPINNARFSDALGVRYGDAGDNYKYFPMNNFANSNPQHMEYAPYQSMTLRNPNDQKLLGRIFRFNTGRWYTLETRYKLSSPGVSNGIVEVWVDGTKIYSASDLATCGTGLGNCSGIGSIMLTAYHNALDTTAWNGQQIVDNLIVSRAYIGPPTGSSDSTPPATPTGLTILP